MATALILSMSIDAQTRVGVMPMEWDNVRYLPSDLSISGTPLLSNEEETGDYTIYNYYTNTLSLAASFSTENISHLMYCVYNDLDNPFDSYIEWGCPCPFSQTLFNNDADWEYLRWNGTADTIREEYYWDVIYTITSFDVVKQNGTVLFTITADNNLTIDYVTALKWGEEYFLAVNEESDDDEYITILYRIDRQTQGISRIDGELPFRVHPTVADRSQTFTVELGDGSNATEVQVVNTLGQVVKTIPVQAGQREVTFSARDLNGGMHIVGTRSKKGQGACKIIVK